MVSLMQGPYPMARFIPTGGIDKSTIASYLKLKNVIACGGSWMTKKELISSHQFETITALTKEALSVIAAELR
jgi:2-dehydro-3-deoxyphosphogluconate aldolase/(4S)-4-hydroxy-2-oxoglutarate aldolase